MKALKALVIVMGILIVAGMGVVAYTVVKRGLGPEPGPATARDAARPDAAGPTATATDPLPAFGERALVLPPGFAPVDMVAEGDRLMVRIEADGRDPRILVLDLRTGRTLGSITLEREADRPPR